jgi:hypothetical protein
MSSLDDTSLRERLSRASAAKAALLVKFKRATDPENPEIVAKRRQRETIAAARAERLALRQREREERESEARKQAALAEAAAEAAAVAAKRAAAEEEARKAAEQAEREVALQAEKKQNAMLGMRRGRQQRSCADEGNKFPIPAMLVGGIAERPGEPERSRPLSSLPFR